MSAAQPSVQSQARLTSTQSGQVLSLADAAAKADGVHPFSEDVVLQLRRGSSAGAVHLLAPLPDGDLAGYAFLSGGSGDLAGELVVHPAHRRQGLGHALATAALRTASRHADTGPAALRFWAHGDHPAARSLAAKLHFARARVLWQLRRPLSSRLPEVPLPSGVALRPFRPGQDEQEWLAVNARAFATHPEQGRWTLDDLRLRMGQPWFDPAGFLLAVDAADDRLLGFHWTKVHPGTDGDGLLDPVGEVYVLGVDPAGHRRGLGAALTVAGLRYLYDRGLTGAMLYVDEANTAAVTLYERLGFTVWSTDVMYGHEG